MLRLLYILAALGKAWAVMQETQRKIDLAEARTREIVDRRALIETKIARENNTIVLQDIQIDIKKLELERLEKEIHPPRFNPDGP